MSGLRAIGYELDIDEFHAYVHGRLMPQRKIVFTNSDEAHAHQVLTWSISFNKLCKSITKYRVDVSSPRQILCKPKAAIQIAHIDSRKTLFFDDSSRNIASGKAAELNTVIVGCSDLMSSANHALNSIHNIKEALPQIWSLPRLFFEQI
uniref:Uncharacterized protein n=1 Tax=Cajanus cajan TaxID=3821 RepID=A0A151TXE7_CAJCA|nr:hypothetical protein KK1_010981 [Cajanus cajan]